MTADGVLTALDELLAAADDRTRIERISVSAELIRERRGAGLPYRAIVAEEPEPLIVASINEHIDALLRASARFRRAKAAALHAEGMTMQEIAELFGITRQRVSALLREAPRNSGS